MRIHSLTIENFRSMQSEVTITFRPLTLLFGPNSAGKSSILQSMLTFREVLHNRNANPHFVFGGGTHIDLGGFKALVHGQDLDRTIRVKICFEIDEDGIDDGSGLSEQLERSNLLQLQNVLEIKEAFVAVALAFDQAIRTPYVSRY